MDPKYIKEIFGFYEPGANLQWLHDALEQMNSNDVLVDLSIATMTCGFLIGFYRYRRSRQAKAKSPSNNIAQTFSNVDLEEHCDIDRLRDDQLIPEIALRSLTADTGALTDDSSDSSTSCLFENANADDDDNTDPLLSNINTPEKDVLDSKENEDATSVTGDNAAKVIYRKAIQDGVNMRLQLLLAEKKIYAQMKKMQSLKRSLLESSIRNYAQDSPFNKTSISISRRKSFFDVDPADKTFLIRSSSTEPKADTKEDEMITKLTNLKKTVSQLIDAHMNELSSLNDRIAEKQMCTKKLEAMKEEIDLLYEIVENEGNKNKESTDNNISDQEQDKNSSYDNNLVNQLQSISSLKDLFKSYDNGRDLSTIMEKTNENTEDSLVFLNDISALKRDLNSVQKSWSRSSTPRKPSPGAQPMST